MRMPLTRNPIGRPIPEPAIQRISPRQAHQHSRWGHHHEVDQAEERCDAEESENPLLSGGSRAEEGPDLLDEATHVPSPSRIDRLKFFPPRLWSVTTSERRTFSKS